LYGGFEEDCQLFLWGFPPVFYPIFSSVFCGISVVYTLVPQWFCGDFLWFIPYFPVFSYGKFSDLSHTFLCSTGIPGWVIHYFCEHFAVYTVIPAVFVR
jgi:hypothetical protein